MLSRAIRERYLRDPLPIRLGGLAADLARIASFAENPKNRNVVESLFEEGKCFAEWAAAEAPIGTQEVLANVQQWLSLWHARWLTGHIESCMRSEAQHWADVLLELSGLTRQSSER